MDRNETCTIVLPLPGRILSPNCPPGSAGGRIAKAMATKRYRRLAREATQEECIESGTWERVEMQATFFHKNKRRRDGVNFNASLKPAQDGIVDAGLVIDDDAESWTTLPPIFKLDENWPRVEIVVERKQP